MERLAAWRLAAKGRLRALAVAALALLASTACTETVASQARPALADLAAPLQRIAVLPFAVAATMQGAESETSPRVAAQLVSRYFAEALAARGVQVIAPEDVASTLAGADPSQRAAAVLREKRGAEAIVLGELGRWEERQGEAYGAMRAAAVGFHVVLQGADGRTLWTGDFDERQQPLGSNVLRAGQYPGGGSRWLTAEELARWGAGETARALPLGPEPAK
jgi:hypothetical protein